MVTGFNFNEVLSWSLECFIGNVHVVAMLCVQLIFWAHVYKLKCPQGLLSNLNKRFMFRKADKPTDRYRKRDDEVIDLPLYIANLNVQAFRWQPIYS